MPILNQGRLLAVLYVPFLRQAFGTVSLGVPQWLVMLPLIFVPALAAEITKLGLRRGAAEPEPA